MDQGTIQIELSDGKEPVRWDCDPGLLQQGRWHHVAVIVDGGAKVITVVVDGEFCDGGTARKQGWHRFRADLGDVNGAGQITVAPSFQGELKVVRIWGRYLCTAEVVGNFRAGAGASR